MAPDSQKSRPDSPRIRVRGARLHNLRGIGVDIPRDRLTVVTGPSGSGKSSLAFDTLHAEGRRRYVESLSIQARRSLEPIAKPDVDQIDGLPPTIAVAPQPGRIGPRATVATLTELHDLLRLLFARLGRPHCVRCGRPVERYTPTRITDRVLALPEGARVMVLAPVVRRAACNLPALVGDIIRDGFVRVRIDGALHEARTAASPIDARPDATSDALHTVEIVIDRLVIRGDIRARIAESIETGLRRGGGWVIVSVETDGAWRDEVFHEHFACAACGLSLPEVEPRLFSFNSPHGACPTCRGLGFTSEFDEALIVPDPSLPLDQAVAPWRAGGGVSAAARRLLTEFCTHFQVAPATPFRAIPARTRRILISGTTAADEKRSGRRFEGVLPSLARRLAQTDREGVRRRLQPFMRRSICSACRGARLRPEALAVHVADLNIDQVVRQPISAAEAWAATLQFPDAERAIAAPIVSELQARLRFLNQVGVGYLGLDRPIDTLSGGELQRIRLATHIGGGLVGVCYVLDEPTIGLHPRDGDRLLQTIRALQRAGNTMIVVEHDETVIRAADYIIEIGPGSGIHGGALIYQGDLPGLLACRDSPTARGLLRAPQPDAAQPDVAQPPSAVREARGTSFQPVSGAAGFQPAEFAPGRAPTRTPRPTNGPRLSLHNARKHNLKGITVEFPIGAFICVTGVSGSGKSSLIGDTLLPALRRRLAGSTDALPDCDALEGAEHIARLVEVDHLSLGRSARGNAATYTGLFDELRTLFAQTREARIRGYTERRFSFNVKGGRCDACQGLGFRRIEMNFLPDVSVPCPECGGTRFNRETLEVKYRGHSIADLLALRVDQAAALLENVPACRRILQALADVGLDYLTLGQPSSTLSGGESQRIRLAAELQGDSAVRTLYVLDEPTTGLHFAEVDRLLLLLNRFVDAGHTVLVIEHHLDVIRQADWIIDLGPEGGDAGGFLVVQGPLAAIMACPESHTGSFVLPHRCALESRGRSQHG